MLNEALAKRCIAVDADMLNRPGQAIKQWLQSAHGLFLSISHCRTAIAVALSEKPIGIDCECAYRPRPWQAMAESAFSKEEALLIKHTAKEQQAQEFLRLWTLKEAGIKAAASDDLLYGLAHIHKTEVNKHEDWQGWQCVIDNTVISLCAWRQHLAPRLHWRGSEELSWQRVGIAMSGPDTSPARRPR